MWQNKEKAMNDLIKVCEEGHHWFKEDSCPFCGKDVKDTVEYREGDCIKCGCLCPNYAYGCTSPEPLVIK